MQQWCLYIFGIIQVLYQRHKLKVWGGKDGIKRQKITSKWLKRLYKCTSMYVQLGKLKKNPSIDTLWVEY